MLYAVAERSAMRQFQKYKDGTLSPLCRLLLRLGITANHISTLSGASAATGLLLALATSNPLPFFVGLWLHVVLDGLDGAMARMQSNTPTGVVADTIADSTGIVSAGIFGYLFADIPLVYIAAFLGTYAALIIISLIRDRRGIPYPFTIRPRFFVYAFLTLDFILGGDTAGLIMAASAIPMGILVATGLRRLA